jgi:hypothetical protein
MEIERQGIKSTEQVDEWKASGKDIITNEMVRRGRLEIVECMVCLFNLHMNMGNAPED